jgi:uncharacterized membrane protein
MGNGLVTAYALGPSTDRQFPISAGIFLGLVPRQDWFIWDIGFTLSGLTLIAIGWALMRAGKRETAQ